MHQTLLKGYDMHRPGADSRTPQGPPIAHRLAAVIALILTPVIGYALGKLAWEQAPALVTNGQGLTLLGPATLTLGQALTPVAAAAGALIAAHLTWTTLVMLVIPQKSRVWAAVAALTPTAWRRIVTIATTGTLSVALAVPATAAVGAIPVENTDAGWVAAPAEATPAATTTTQATTDQAANDSDPTSASALSNESKTPAADTSEVIVTTGDTLWDITATQLDLAASDHSAIAAAWPDLYEENRDVIGNDPGLIEPQQRLTVPEGWSA